ncbi:MAG: cell surface protein SprA [bacterium]|nr:cell surface protein SprA [bacterium]
MNGACRLDSAIDSGGFVDRGLYTLPYTQVQSGGRLWRFQTEYKGTTSQYDLGPLVLEGSEEITLNGNRLMRGSDYTIDYLSGQLKILSEAAKAANANLEITYESGQVFQLDRKTLLGARAEYELWQDSYIGGMMLHLNEKSLDQRVRIGNEPIRNTLYDMDTQLKFKPNFLTAIADRLPLVRTNVASEFVVDGEAAKVFPNPNSLSNSGTGDPNGVAFLDDFEASRRSVPLGMQRRNWSISSIPSDPDVDPNRGRFRWWNPRPEDQVKVQDVYPRREVNSQVADRLQSLVMEYAPVGETDIEKEHSWGGVMRYLGAGYEDQSRAQFLEFWIQLPPRPQGRLVVDIGNISEDALPNDTMNTEDRPVEGEVVTSPRTEYGDGILTSAEDTGIDGIDATDPADSAFWNGTSRPKVPSMDDWQYSIGSGDYLRINGSENSLNDESSNFPDSEDLNNNQSLDQVNEYFSYSIELNNDNPYIAGGSDNNNRWRLFRIPIDTDDPRIRRTVGNPTLTNIRFARMYLTGITDSVRIQIVQNDIVSNEWLPDFLPDSVEYISAAVINNHENPEYYSPPGVQGEIDPITNLRQREQSLALKINHLGSSGAPKEFFVAKNLFQQINMIEYKRLKMFIHGGGEDETQFEDGKYQLVLRLGTSYSNTDANYYDIVKTIYKGWDPRNQIDIAMNDLSILSAWREDPTRADYDSVRAAGFRKFAVVLDSINFPQDSLIINGRPSLQNVGFIALGVRSGKHYNNVDDEIWVDELRVSDIYKDPGMAGEVTTSLKIADLLTATAAYTKRDADFHNVNTRTGDQRTSETKRGSLGLSLQKFGLEQYGFVLPVNINFTETDAVPKYVPNTDARVDQDHPDTTVVSKQVTTTYNASFTKSGNSPNPLVRWTAEKLRLTWDHSDSRSKDYLTLKQEQKTTNTRAEYTFPTARGRGIAPFWFLNGVPLLSQIGNPHIFYKPKQLSGSLAARRTQAERQTRVGQRTFSPDFTATGAAAVGWDLTEALGTGFSQTYGWTQIENVLLDESGDGVPDSAVARAKEWNKLRLTRDDLNAEAWAWNNTYAPQLASWFAPTLNYSSTYNWARQNQGGGRNPSQQTQNQNLQNSRNAGGDVSLDLKSIFGGGGVVRGRGREPLRDQQNRRPVVNMDSTRTDSTRTDSLIAERAPGFSPLQFLGKAFVPFKKAIGVLDPVTISYDNSQSHSRSAVSGQGSLGYRLGFTDNPGDVANRVVSSDGVQINGQGTRNQTQDYTARSGIRLSRDIRTTYAWNMRNTVTETTTKSRALDQTYFWLADDNGVTTAIPLTDVTVDWAGFERLPFLSKVARTVSLTSGLSSRYKQDWSGNPLSITNRTYSRQWNPLVGVNVSWLNSLDSQLRINSSNTFAEATVTDNKSRGSTKGATATVSYTMRTGFRLPILWFGAMRLENSTTFSLNVDYSMTTQDKKDSGFTGWSPQRNEVSWSVQPRMNYTFSSTVQGGAQVQYQQTKDKITDRGSRLFEFGINVSIAIRG